MNDKELYALAAEAEKLAQETNAKLDDRDYIFRGYSATQLVVQLREVGERCHAAGLRAAARRLEQMARDVQQRTEK
jgi:hypothetical protein